MFETTAPPTPISVRWMIRRDLDDVVAIRNASCVEQTTSDNIKRRLTDRHTIGMVATRPSPDPAFYERPIVGFMIYELRQTTIHLGSMAVHPDHRRRGVGRELIARLKSKLDPAGRWRITLYVRESNDQAIALYRSEGFKALGVTRDHFHIPPEDAYRFLFTLPR
ncbi:MAG: GNAT family N-acetyltransferase [Gemmatimonadota bacterium]|nr:GNAT family N-acetyltransferase [Gemmatimonadota bacterium]